MMEWLKTTGSPKSIIEKAVFKNEQMMDQFNYSEFSIKHTVYCPNYTFNIVILIAKIQIIIGAISPKVL